MTSFNINLLTSKTVTKHVIHIILLKQVNYDVDVASLNTKNNNVNEYVNNSWSKWSTKYALQQQ